jgi:hypothetical protein
MVNRKSTPRAAAEFCRSLDSPPPSVTILNPSPRGVTLTPSASNQSNRYSTDLVDEELLRMVTWAKFTPPRSSIRELIISIALLKPPSRTICGAKSTFDRGPPVAKVLALEHAGNGAASRAAASSEIESVLFTMALHGAMLP